jgi:hypothetical protein
VKVIFMSWSRTHVRQQLIRAALADIADTGRPELPAALTARIDAEYGGFAEFLLAVQVLWYRTFDARLDAVLETWPSDTRGALIQLEKDVDEALTGARILLDAHHAHPVLADVRRRHHRTLSWATGVSVPYVEESDSR